MLPLAQEYVCKWWLTSDEAAVARVNNDRLQPRRRRNKKPAFRFRSHWHAGLLSSNQHAPPTTRTQTCLNFSNPPGEITSTRKPWQSHSHNMEHSIHQWLGLFHA